MNLEWEPADIAFRQEVRDWLSANVPGERRPPGTEGAEFDRAWQRRLYEAGWAGLNWPAEYGGRGLSLLQQMIWFEEYAKAGGPAAGTMFVAIAHAGPTLIALGDDHQKARHLDGILRGDQIWCQGFSEPGAGSDLASLRTRGVVDGDEIIVTGQKIWTSFADKADFQELLIRTDPDSARHKGLSWVICDMRSPGITVQPIRKMTGTADFCSVFYDEVRIPLSNVVGSVNQGWKTAMATLGFERGTAFIGDAVTLTHRVKELIEYAKCTVLPGARGPAWSDDEMRRRLMRLQAEVAGLRALNYVNLSRYESGAVPGGEGSVVKLYTNQLAEEIGRTAVDLMVTRLADGRSRENEWRELWFHNIVHAIGGGTADIQREIIADRVLDLPRSR